MKRRQRSLRALSLWDNKRRRRVGYLCRGLQPLLDSFTPSPFRIFIFFLFPLLSLPPSLARLLPSGLTFDPSADCCHDHQPGQPGRGNPGPGQAIVSTGCPCPKPRNSNASPALLGVDPSNQTPATGPKAALFRGQRHQRRALWACRFSP